MRFRIAQFCPDGEGGGQDVTPTDAGQNGKLPDALMGLLKSKSIELPDDLPEPAKEALSFLFTERGKHIKESESQRKRARDAEGKFAATKIEDLLGTVDDTTKDKLAGLVTDSKKTAQFREALGLIADAGLPLSQEMLDLAEAGPVATKAALTHIGKTPAATGEPVNELDKLAQAVAKVLGLGADQAQQQQNKETQKPDPLAGLRAPRDERHAILDRMKAAARGKE